MKKKMIESRERIDWDDCTLSELKEIISEKIDQYGGDAVLDYDWDYGLALLFEREETDEEYDERLKKEEAKKNKSLAAKKRQIEKLQKEIEKMESDK